MAFSLDLSGLIATAKADAQVNLKLVADQSIIQRASLNNGDITDDITADGKGLSFAVPAGRNTIILVVLPPAASETMKLVEDGGNGTTQTILSFGIGLHASISFDIMAS